MRLLEYESSLELASSWWTQRIRKGGVPRAPAISTSKFDPSELFFSVQTHYFFFGRMPKKKRKILK